MTAHATTQCFDLGRGDLMGFDDARGATLRVSLGTLWLTQHGHRDDVVLQEGDAYTIERDGLTLLEAQSASAFCVVGAEAPVQRRSRRGLERGGWRAWIGALTATRGA